MLWGHSILEKPDRIAIAFWENDSFVILLSRVDQRAPGKVADINPHENQAYA
jgi:hypothetical protein